MFHEVVAIIDQGEATIDPKVISDQAITVVRTTKQKVTIDVIILRLALVFLFGLSCGSAA